MARMIFAIAAFIAGVAPMTVPSVSPETAVFAALLDNIGMGTLPDTLLLGDSTLQFHAPTAANSRSWRAQFDSIPAQLPIRLEEISKTKVATESLALPRPMRVLTRAELREIFSADPTSN
jgi:hypothetical protein